MTIFQPSISKKEINQSAIRFFIVHGYQRFAWLPVHLEDGSWLWLEKYWEYGLAVFGSNHKPVSWQQILKCDTSRVTLKIIGKTRQRKPRVFDSI